jgi:hypothetical protein
VRRKSNSECGLRLPVGRECGMEKVNSIDAFAHSLVHSSLEAEGVLTTDLTRLTFNPPFIVGIP